MINGLYQDGHGGFVFIEGSFMRLCDCKCSNIAAYDPKLDKVYCPKCWENLKVTRTPEPPQ